MSGSITVRQVEAGDDGTEIPVNDLEKTYDYTNGVITTATLAYSGVTYVKTYTYTNGVCTGVSLWEAQP